MFPCAMDRSYKTLKMTMYWYPNLKSQDGTNTWTQCRSLTQNKNVYDLPWLVSMVIGLNQTVMSFLHIKCTVFHLGIYGLIRLRDY